VAEVTSLTALSPGIDPTLASANATLARARKLEGSPGSAKIQKAAQEFESILLTQWLEQARQSFSVAPGGDEDDPADPGGEQMLSLGTQSLAAAVTKSGGIGIARMLTRHLESHNSEAATHPEALTDGVSANPINVLGRPGRSEIKKK
jgi:Rod binding domain-containing protein